MAVNINRTKVYADQNKLYGILRKNRTHTGLTAAQNKRLSKKLNQAENRVKKALKSGALTSADVQKALSNFSGIADVETSGLFGKQTAEALTMVKSCPVCFATGDEPCITKTGNTAKAPHKGRKV